MADLGGTDGVRAAGGAGSGARRRPLRVALLLLLAPLVLVGPSLRPGVRFLPQAPVQFEPLASEHPEAAAAASRGMNHWTGDRVFPVLSDQREIAARFHTGEGLAWEPNLGLGLPLLGNVVHGPLSPQHWLSLAVAPDRAAGWEALLSLFLAGLGLWLFLGRLGLSTPARFVAAIALQSVGWGVVNLHYPMKVDAVLWLPWSLWAVEGLARGRRGSDVALVVAVALSLLAGFPPIALFALGVTVAYALVRLGGLFLGGDALGGRGLRSVVGAVVLGGLLGSPQLLPTLEASLHSLRTPKGPAELAAEALPAQTTLSLLVPDLYGSPLHPAPPFGPAAAWWLADAEDVARTQGANPLEWRAWAGAATLAFALVGLLARPRRAAFPLATVLAAFAFAQGWPLAADLLYRVPLVGGGAPSRALAVAWIGWAWLAALGLDALLVGEERARRAALWTAGAAATLGGVLVALGLALHPGAIAQRTAERYDRPLEEVLAAIPPDAAQRAVDHVGTAGLLWLAVAVALGLVALWRRAGRPRPAVVVAAAAALLAVEVGAVSRAHLLPRDLGGLPAWPASEALATVGELASGGRVLRIDRSESGLADVLRLARPNLLQAYEIADTSAYVAFTPRRTVELFAAVDPGAVARSGVAALRDPERLDHPALDLAHVTGVLSTEPLDHPRLAPWIQRPGFHAYRRSSAGTGARIVPSAIAAPGEEAALELIRQGHVDPLAFAYVDAEPDALPRPRPGEGAWLRLVRPDPSTIEVAVPDGASGLLVVADGHGPGWRVELDGVRGEVLRADHAFLGVLVPEGVRVVRFEYRPSSLRVGVALGGLALLALLALAWRGPRVGAMRSPPA